MMDVRAEEIEIKHEPLEPDMDEEVSRIVICSLILGWNKTKLPNSTGQVTILSGRYIWLVENFPAGLWCYLWSWARRE